MAELNISQIIAESIERGVMSTRVVMPCVVLDVNEDKSLVTVIIAHKQRVLEPLERILAGEDYLEIPDVPVAHYSCNFGYTWAKIEPECHGELHFCDFDTQRYVNTGEIEDLASSRFHDFADGFFVPGGFSWARRIDPIEADFGISSLNGLAGVHIAGDELKLFGSPVSINGVVVAGVNGLGSTPVPEESTAEEKEVRR